MTGQPVPLLFKVGMDIGVDLAQSNLRDRLVRDAVIRCQRQGAFVRQDHVSRFSRRQRTFVTDASPARFSSWNSITFVCGPPL